MASCSTTDKLLRVPSDEDLMLAVRAGDLNAFEPLVIRYQRSAWNAAYRFLGDTTEAEDIAQQAFLRILDARSRYEPAATFRTYLYRVVTRLCLDHVQKKRPVYSDHLPDHPEGGDSPLEGMAARELQREIRQCLDELPAKQRIAVVWKYYEGLSYAEIAAALQTTVKAVERLLARARDTLATSLGPYLETQS